MAREAPPVPLLVRLGRPAAELSSGFTYDPQRQISILATPSGDVPAIHTPDGSAFLKTHTIAPGED
jgi:hypothetical protein